MTIDAATGQPFPRGAKPSPPWKLLSAHPYRAFVAPPLNFAVVPPKLDPWDNDREGVCVSTEEMWAKAVYSIMSGLPELFGTAEEVRSFAHKHGWSNGAGLTEVMDVMISEGMIVAGTNYKDGKYSGVNYADDVTLRSAISTGPVKIAIDANALPSSAGNQQGWHKFGGTPGEFGNTDHCVGLSGAGSASFCFAALGVAVPAGIDPAKPDCRLLFTWGTYGVVDQPWVMSTCVEAWVRNPTTVGQSPTPVPPGPTPTPTPIPGGNYDLSGVVTMPGMFGHYAAPFTGTASPHGGGLRVGGTAPSVWTLIRIAAAIYADYKSGAGLLKMIADVEAILAGTASHGPAGALEALASLPWALLWQVLGVIYADVAKGASVMQIVQDVLALLIPAPVLP